MNDFKINHISDDEVLGRIYKDMKKLKDRIEELEEKYYNLRNNICPSNPTKAFEKYEEEIAELKEKISKYNMKILEVDTVNKRIEELENSHKTMMDLFNQMTLERKEIAELKSVLTEWFEFEFDEYKMLVDQSPLFGNDVKLRLYKRILERLGGEIE